MKRRVRYRPPPRLHPLIVGPDRDYRGKVICLRCGSTEDASVHLPAQRAEEEADEAKAVDARWIGERDG